MNFDVENPYINSPSLSNVSEGIFDWIERKTPENSAKGDFESLNILELLVLGTETCTMHICSRQKIYQQVFLKSTYLDGITAHPIPTSKPYLLLSFTPSLDIFNLEDFQADRIETVLEILRTRFNLDENLKISQKIEFRDDFSLIID